MRKAIFLLLILASTSSASAQASTTPAIKADHVMGVCQLIGSPKNDVNNPSWVNPIYAAYSNLSLDTTEVGLDSISKNASITILQSPAHGVLKHVTDENQIEIWGQPVGKSWVGAYVYIPEINYNGEDSLTVQVDLEGYGPIKIIYFLHMLDRSGDFADAQYREWFSEEPSRDPCGNEGADKMWEISSTEFKPSIQVVDLAKNESK